MTRMQWSPACVKGKLRPSRFSSIQIRPPVSASGDARIRERCQRPADDVNEDRYVGAFGGHVALQHLDGIGEIVAVQLRLLELDDDLLKGVALDDGNVGVGRIGLEAVLAFRSRRG